MTISKRNQQLQKLGIIQWVLRRPAVLRREITVPFPIHIQLVIVTNNLFTLNETLLNDVLYALKLSTHQVLQITPDRAETLLSNNQCNSWWLGCKRRILKLRGHQLISPTLEELQRNPYAKSALWKQICKYEYTFFFHDA